jgi:hypothetical protein
MFEYHIELVNNHTKPACVELKLCNGDNTVHTRNISMCADQYKLKDIDIFIWDTPPGHCDSVFSIQLMSPCDLKINKGEVYISEVCLHKH